MEAVAGKRLTRTALLATSEEAYDDDKGVEKDRKDR